VTTRRNYYNISSTTNATIAKKKSTATLGETAATTKKAIETSQELLCNIKETPVATTKKRHRATFHIICCNIEND